MNTSRISGLSLALLFGATVAGPAGAGFFDAAPPRDIEMCVAEIRARAEFPEASRVRHAVESTKRSVGYSLEIETTVYSPTDAGAVLRRYATVCVATGGSVPSRFRIEQTD